MKKVIKTGKDWLSKYEIILDKGKYYISRHLKPIGKTVRVELNKQELNKIINNK